MNYEKIVVRGVNSETGEMYEGVRVQTVQTYTLLWCSSIHVFILSNKS